MLLEGERLERRPAASCLQGRQAASAAGIGSRAVPGAEIMGTLPGCLPGRQVPLGLARRLQLTCVTDW